MEHHFLPQNIVMNKKGWQWHKFGAYCCFVLVSIWFCLFLCCRIEILASDWVSTPFILERKHQSTIIYSSFYKHNFVWLFFCLFSSRLITKISQSVVYFRKLSNMLSFTISLVYYWHTHSLFLKSFFEFPGLLILL